VTQRIVTRTPQRRRTRRAILAGIAAALARAPLVAQAQPHDGVRRIGVLMATHADDPEGQLRAAAIIQGLGEHGWIEGGNLRIDWRWAGSDSALYERYAAELIVLGPEVILAIATAAVEALRRQASAIPIVFAGVTDPIGQGFVASLAHPGGAITGFSLYEPPMIGKWLGMLTQISPPVARVTVIYNPETAPSAGMLGVIEEAGAASSVAVRGAQVHDGAGIEAVAADLAREGQGGLLVLPDPFNTNHRDAIVALAVRYRLPSVYAFRIFTVLGGLMSYGVDISDLYRRSAAYVDRILRGAKPADLPVQAPTKFEIVINLKTAKSLGFTVAPALLATADEVIE